MATNQLLLLLLLIHHSLSDLFPVRMPLVTPTVNEVYLCTRVYIGQESPYWLTGFTPVYNPHMVHHMVLAGCATNPVQGRQKVWNCGHSTHAAVEPGLEHSTTCVDGGQGSRSLFVWSDRGDKFRLPPDTGYPVGQNSQYQYLVLQVHYANITSQPAQADTSGIDLHYTAVAPGKSAGMISLHLSPMVPAHSTTVEEGGCQMQEDKMIHPLALLGHTHSLGTMVQLWRVRGGQWNMLGEVDGQAPQSFYSVSGVGMSLEQGDWLAGRCRMVSDRDTDTKHGLASYEEMCNIYMVYSVEGDHNNLLEGNTYCITPHQVSWASLGISGAENVP